MSRPKANKYLEMMKELEIRTYWLQNNAKQRLFELSSRYPEIPIANMDNTDVKAKSLTKQYIQDMPFNNIIYYIDIIEKYLADQEKVKQLEIEFPK
jgi:hypothetical protein